MSKVRVLGLAAGALLLFGVQQIAGAATAAAQDNPAEVSAATDGVDKATYHERQGQGRGNIYGSQGVIGHTGAAVAHGYYSAAGRRPHYHAHRYYRPRFDAARGYYGAAGYNSRYYARRYYPTRAVVADSSYGSTGYYPQYYSHRYYPTRPAAADSLFGSTSYSPQYYSHRYYPARPAAVDGYSAASGYYPQYNSRRYYPTQPVGAAVASTDLFAPTNWRAGCVNGMVCTGGYSYHRGVPICRGWAACNY
jgi:hypothetical protein